MTRGNISNLPAPFPTRFQAPIADPFFSSSLLYPQNSRMLFPSLPTLPSRTFKKPHTSSQIHILQLISTGRNDLPHQYHQKTHSYRYSFRGAPHHLNNKHPSFLHSHRQKSQSSTFISLPKPVHAHLTPKTPVQPLPSFPRTEETASLSAMATNNNIFSSPKASPKSSRQQTSPRPRPRGIGSLTSTIWIHTVQTLAQRQNILRPNDCL